jgi:peroxiredoxin
MILELGSAAPDFKLLGIDGKDHALGEFSAAKALCVIFSCNHCPYVQAYEGRMIGLQKKYGPQGAQLVAINSNDSEGYPEDSFENMKIRAKEQGYNFPYLRDKSQQVAHAYGAQRTPHIFLFDANRKLAYLGRIDDNYKDPAAVKAHELADAIEDILAGKPPRLAETFAVGCTIKWKE